MRVVLINDIHQRLETTQPGRLVGIARFVMVDDNHYTGLGSGPSLPASDVEAITKLVTSELDSADSFLPNGTNQGHQEWVLVASRLRTDNDLIRLADRVVGHLVSHSRDRWAIGLALGDSRSYSAEGLMREAALAVDQARNEPSPIGVVRLDDMGRLAAQAEDRLRSELPGAIDSGELELYYQPVVDIEQGTIVSVEGLVRWCHPRRGVLLPPKVVPMAARMGLSGPLTRVLFDSLVRRMALWSQADNFQLDRQDDQPPAESKPLTGSINLDITAMVWPGLAPAVSQAMADWRLDAAQLQVEVSHETADTYPQLVEAGAARLADLDLSLTVDNIVSRPGEDLWTLPGLKTMKLANLHRLGAHLDNPDVEPQPSNRRGTPWSDLDPIRDLVEQAASYGVEVVATGVETDRQLETVREAGIRLAQGFLIQRPVPASGMDSIVHGGG